MDIAINGLGRIGRAILRLVLGARSEGLNVVALNDIAAPDLIAYLIEYDSVFGPFPGSVDVVDGALVLCGRHIPITSHADPAALKLDGVDLLLECTGKAETRDWIDRALSTGVKRVLISGPSPAADRTIVLGANEGELGSDRAVSNASCTTNAVAPLLKMLDGFAGIVAGHMTTIHCYTGSQPTVDAPRGDFARSRAAALSMIPTTTSAARVVEDVLPGVGARVTCHSVRVPTASVSAVDLVVETARPVTIDEVNGHIRSCAGPVIGLTDRPLVSSDLRGRPESIVLSLLETDLSGGLLRVFGWYDNEWGFSNRMVDMTHMLGGSAD